MPLNIFISSVSKEFDIERESLRLEIIALRDLFIGMEFFGSESDAPAEYCIKQVENSDLYVGIIGIKLGSIHPSSKLSFTEVEYEAAISYKVPCLIYIDKHCFEQNGIIKSDINAAQKTFIENLRNKHIVYLFENSIDLKLQFLRDFIKLLRKSTFTKIIPEYNGAISAEILHGITKGIINEQIKSVGQEKYIKEIYTERNAESKIDEFTGYERKFLQEAEIILGKLLAGAKSYGFEQRALEPIIQLDNSLKNDLIADQSTSLELLKQAFKFHSVAGFIEEMDEILAITSTLEVKQRVYDLIYKLKQAQLLTKREIAESFSEGIIRAKTLETRIYKRNCRLSRSYYGISLLL
jgi:hypothetical protein